MRRIRRRERLEELKDLRHLEVAIAESADQPLIPREQGKAQDALNFTAEFEAFVQQTESEIAEGKVAGALTSQSVGRAHTQFQLTRPRRLERPYAQR